MPRNRFVFLTTFLLFDNCETRYERQPLDNRVRIKHILEMFAENCSKDMRPGPQLFVDLRLGFRWKAPFSVHIKGKTEK